jgi:hypothetical protein
LLLRLVPDPRATATAYIRVQTVMAADRPLPCCDRCGDIIGVYEPLTWMGADGEPVESSWLHVARDPAAEAPGSVFFHRACFESSMFGQTDFRPPF